MPGGKADYSSGCKRQKNNYWRMGFGRVAGLKGCFFFDAVFIIFDDEIILSFSDKNGHVFLLYQLQQGKEKKNGVDPPFTMREYLFKRNYFFSGDQ